MKNWKIDTAHTNIGFNVKHMMFSKIRGNFKNYQASVEMADDNFENAKLSFEAEASSITTNNEQRDAHLQSADFFNVEKDNKISFESTKITKKGDNDYLVEGNLTMNGNTKQVTLSAQYSGAMTDPFGQERVALVMEGKLNREDWGINWNKTLEVGGVMVSKDVNLEINSQFI